MGHLQLTRTPVLDAQDLESVEQGAIRILGEVGVEVAHPQLAARARERGFQLQDGRIRLPRRQVERFLEEGRSAGRPGSPVGREDEGRICLRLSPNPYPQSIHDPATDEIVPLTCARLEEATKLVDVLAERGVAGGMPGCPTDVPPPLQVLAQYRIGVSILRNWQGPVDPKSLTSLPYVMAMADVMGCPIRGLPVYIFSPLRLAGESLTAALQYEERLEHLFVGSMPAVGNTCPIRPLEALAVAAAEIIGSAMILQGCLRARVHWGVGVFSFDLRGMAMSFGSPEAILLDMASHEVDAFLHGREWWPAVGNLLTLAKLPDQQALAEKAAALTLGAGLGGRTFDGAGTLALDEVFSPVQLLLDVEMKDHVERLVNGVSRDFDLDALMGDLGSAVTRGFAALDRTLDSHAQYTWYPRLFERRFLAPWRAAGCPGPASRAAEQARELAGTHTYSPPHETLAALDRIYRQAEKDILSQ